MGLNRGYASRNGVREKLPRLVEVIPFLSDGSAHEKPWMRSLYVSGSSKPWSCSMPHAVIEKIKSLCRSCSMADVSLCCDANRPFLLPHQFTMAQGL